MGLHSCKFNSTNNPSIVRTKISTGPSLDDSIELLEHGHNEDNHFGSTMQSSFGPYLLTGPKSEKNVDFEIRSPQESELKRKVTMRNSKIEESQIHFEKVFASLTDE